MNKLLFMLWLCAMLSACASIPKNRGADVTRTLIATHSDASYDMSLSNASDTQNLVDQLVATPLTADAAVQIALLNNARLRVLYAELGVAQADLYDASRLANPTLGFTQLSAQGSVAKTTWSISQRFTELLFLHFNTSVARDELLRTQQRVANDVLTLEAQVRSAYYSYVSARMIARMREQISATTSASAQYAAQLYAAGNISQLQSTREQIVASEALIEQHQAEVKAERAYVVLLNILGLQYNRLSPRVDEHLSVPVEAPIDISSLQTWALTQRLDLVATREELKTTQLQLQHVQHWRWLGGAQIGFEREHDKGSAAATGPSAALEVPLFNRGGGAIMRARTHIERLSANLMSMELMTHNDIASQVGALRHAQQVVDQYQHSLLSLRQQVLLLTQQRYNYMLTGTPELLLAKQQVLNGQQDYIEAVRDYWLTYVELLRMAGGKLPVALAQPTQFIDINNDDVNDIDKHKSDVHTAGHEGSAHE